MTPTQAQIEAAAVELSNEHPRWPWECCLEIGKCYLLLHHSRMEAAVQVGEQSTITTPTQAQIEAAAKAFHEQSCDVDIWPCTFCLDGAEGALTAAAQVGEPNWHHGDKLLKMFDREAEAATIERCAQVVEQYDKERGHTLNSDIAAAIRKLKDE